MPHPGLHQLASKHLVALDRSLLDGMAADLPARRCVHAAKMLGEKLLSAWAIQRRKVLVPKLVQIGERILGTVDGIGALQGAELGHHVGKLGLCGQNLLARDRIVMLGLQRIHLGCELTKRLPGALKPGSKAALDKLRRLEAGGYRSRAAGGRIIGCARGIRRCSHFC
jgi:hypothetical protein